MNNQSPLKEKNVLHSVNSLPKIPNINLGLYLIKSVFYWAYFQGRLLLEGLIIGSNFVFQNGLGFTVKTV